MIVSFSSQVSYAHFCNCCLSLLFFFDVEVEHGVEVPVLVRLLSGMQLSEGLSMQSVLESHGTWITMFVALIGSSLVFLQVSQIHAEMLGTLNLLLSSVIRMTWKEIFEHYLICLLRLLLYTGEIALGIHRA